MIRVTTLSTNTIRVALERLLSLPRLDAEQVEVKRLLLAEFDSRKRAEMNAEFWESTVRLNADVK